MRIHFGQASDQPEPESTHVAQSARRKRGREDDAGALSPHYPRGQMFGEVSASCLAAAGGSTRDTAVLYSLATLPDECVFVLAKGPSLAVFALLLQTCKTLHGALQNHRGELTGVIAAISRADDPLATLVAWTDAVSLNGDRKSSEPALLRSLSQKLFGGALFTKTPSGMDEMRRKPWSARLASAFQQFPDCRLASARGPAQGVEIGRPPVRVNERLAQIRDLRIADYFVSARSGADERIVAQWLTGGYPALPAFLNIPVLEVICTYASTSSISDIGGRFAKGFLEAFDGILPPISKSCRLLLGETMCRIMPISNGRGYLAQRLSIPADVLSTDWDPMIAEIIVRQLDTGLACTEWALPIEGEITVELAERYGLRGTLPRWFPVFNAFSPRRVNAPATLEDACEQWSPGNAIFKQSVVRAYLRHVVKKVPADCRYLLTPSGSDIFQARMSRNIREIVTKVDADTIAALAPDAAQINAFLAWNDRMAVQMDLADLRRLYSDIKKARWEMQPILMKRWSQRLCKEAMAYEEIIDLIADMQVWRASIVAKCAMYPRLVGDAWSAIFYAGHACGLHTFPLSNEIDHYFALHPVVQWGSALDALANILPWDRPKGDCSCPEKLLVDKLLCKINLFLRNPNAHLTFPSVRLHRLVIQQAGIVWSALTHLDALPEEKIRAFARCFHFHEAHLKLIRESVQQTQFQRFLRGQCTISDAYAGIGVDDPSLLRRMEEDVWTLKIQPEVGRPDRVEIALAKYGIGSAYLVDRANALVMANETSRIRPGR